MTEPSPITIDRKLDSNDFIVIAGAGGFIGEPLVGRNVALRSWFTSGAI
jgi:hypothetical protein